ncbi:MAG TPA: SDR family oxidoreductase [Pseudolysinimonas sp.]|nr:SDR family oxidoreductase [Pseudolysinimonas sp.]
MTPAPSRSQRATTDLGSAHVFLTGATGFVGQAVLERLLSAHPETTVSILVRTKAGEDPSARVAELLAKPVFQSWRNAVGDKAVEKAAKERIRIVEGAMGSIPELPKDLDVAIHSASVVSFDPPIDEAFDTNVNGAINLYERLLETGGDPRVVHVSTCYVGGLRKGVAPEARLTHEVDWRTEYAAARAARERVEILSREPDRLRSFMDAARAKHGKEGPQAVAKASEEARIRWVTAELVDAGRTRAQSLGWTDVYTLTKAFSERAAEELWGENGHRLSIVRPAIIESALKHPFPGWIDGFKVADPLIIAYGRGLLPEFPGLPDSILDVIPVDYVVNAILAAAANPAEKNAPEYYHVASGASNPLPFHQEFGYVNRYFTEHPMKNKQGEDLVVPTWKFPVGNKLENDVLRKEKLAVRAEKLLGRLPDTERVRRWHNQMIRNITDLETLRNFTQLYRVYVQTEIIFDDRNLRALHDALPANKRADFGFDIAAIDWEDYMLNVHFPAIIALTTEFSARRAAKKAAAVAAAPPSDELAARSDVLAVFDLEGTVVDSNIVQQYLWVRSAGVRKAAWPGEVLSILGSLRGYLRAEKRDRGEFIRSFLRRYEGMPVARLERIVHGGFADTMYRHTSPAAIRAIKAHRDAGHRTVLVTGSIETLAEPLAGLFDEVVGGHMHEKDGVLTGYLAKPPLVDEARAAWVRRYAEEHGLDLAASYGYGDSHADLVWLELLGNPHAVNPDTQLAREAQRRNWEIDKWKRGTRSPKRDVMVATALHADRAPGHAN